MYVFVDLQQQQKQLDSYLSKCLARSQQASTLNKKQLETFGESSRAKDDAVGRHASEIQKVCRGQALSRAFAVVAPSSPRGGKGQRAKLARSSIM
jgi:hypothetical protein